MNSIFRINPNCKWAKNDLQSGVAKVPGEVLLKCPYGVTDLLSHFGHWTIFYGGQLEGPLLNLRFKEISISPILMIFDQEQLFCERRVHPPITHEKMVLLTGCF